MSELQDSARCPVQETRLSQARDLRRILGASGLKVTCPAPSSNLEIDHRFNNPYGKLAEKLYFSFLRQALETGDVSLIELAGRPNILNGCYIVTKILSYGPKAYARYINSQ